MTLQSAFLPRPTDGPNTGYGLGGCCAASRHIGYGHEDPKRTFVDLASRRVCTISPAPALRLRDTRQEPLRHSPRLERRGGAAGYLDLVETGESRTPRPEKGRPEVLQACPALVLVRRAVAGPASPDRADKS